jgi:hypothetical protein
LDLFELGVFSSRLGVSGDGDEHGRSDGRCDPQCEADRSTISHRPEEMPMKFMIMWKASPVHYTTAVKRFLKTGAPAPKGLKTIGRWHTAGSSRGFHLVEGSEAALAEINAEWADLLELEVVPVVEDDVAGAVAEKVYGKK